MFKSPTNGFLVAGERLGLSDFGGQLGALDGLTFLAPRILTWEVDSGKQDLLKTSRIEPPHRQAVGFDDRRNGVL